MKWIYFIAGISILIVMLIASDPVLEAEKQQIVEILVQETGIPNAVSGIIFKNRLYDTLFEVVVFSISVMGVRHLLAGDRPLSPVQTFIDYPSVVLAQLGATIATLISVELAIRGHLSPGGGFAAGVAGGTALGLISITASPQYIDALYQRWHAATIEKLSVLLFIGIALLELIGTAWGFALPTGELGSLVSGGWIPFLNALVALKVALGSWAIILLFIRHRGLL